MTACSAEQFGTHSERKTATQVYRDLPADFIPRKLTVVSAGDSLTQGVGDSSDSGGYLPYLKTMLEKEKGIEEVNFSNFGVTGNRTTQLLKRLKSEKLKTAIQNADLVIITIGGNDIMKVVRDNITNLQVSTFKQEKSKYIVHLEQIMNAIHQENSQVSIVLVGMYNPFSLLFSNIQEMNDIVADWNQAGRSVVARYSNAYFVDIEDLFLNGNEDLLFTDHFHPNDKGYELIAGRLNDTLEAQAIPNLDHIPFVVSKEEN